MYGSVLQHPPKCVEQIIAGFEEGYEVINMVRTKQVGRIHGVPTSSAFYKLINKISDVLRPMLRIFAMTEPAAKVLRKITGKRYVF